MGETLHRNLNEETLQQLPQDGNLTDIQFLHLGDTHSKQPEPPEDQYGAKLSTSFVPNATQQKTEQETVQQSLQYLQSGSSHTLMWPTIGSAPINEFTTEGYFSMAFPTLFPTGAADFLGQRCNQVTIGNYIFSSMRTVNSPGTLASIFYFEHRDKVACSSSRKNLHPTTPR